MHADPKSVVGSVIVSAQLQHVSYRIEKILQSAIYGAVYQAEEVSSTGMSTAMSHIYMYIVCVHIQWGKCVTQFP